MKPLKCECCGAPLKPSMFDYETYICEYCGSRYERKNGDQVIRIETFQNPVRTFAAKTMISNEAIMAMGEEKAAEYSIRELTHNLAESLTPYLTVEKEYNPMDMKHYYYC